MANEFYALLGRMRYITRWGLMRNSFSENIQEHSHQVAVLAHALALIRRDILNLPAPDPDRCAVAALYHDASEILTGDMPTPIKYYNPHIMDAYKQVEHIANQHLLDLLPQQLRRAYEPYLQEEDPQITRVEEQKAGNLEFESAARQTMATMREMKQPELEWFIAECLPAFSRNLDELGTI